MRKNPERNHSAAKIGKAAAAVLVLTALSALVGCQGVSQSGGNSQQIGNLVMGSGSINFGNVAPGATKNMTVTASNSGNKAVSIGSASISTKYFVLSPLTFPVSVPAGQSTSLTISFTPNVAGPFSANLALSSDASDGTQTVALSGTGVSSGDLSADQTSLSFASVTVGNTASRSEVITNTGGSSVTVSQVGTTGTGFSVSGFTLPLTLNPRDTITLNASFAPTSAGVASGNLTVTSSASNSTLAIPLSGTGTAAQTHTVSLSWTASTSQNISGYNIYRALYTTSCGSFTKVNGTLNAGTTYTDTSVTNGSRYCYATTAVNATNVESAYSNIVTNIQIPAQ